MLARQSKERPGIRKSYMDEVLRKGTAVHDKHRAVTWDSVEYASPRLPPPALYDFSFLMIFVCLKGSSKKCMFHDGFGPQPQELRCVFVFHISLSPLVFLVQPNSANMCTFSMCADLL
jgi:hypothetical protein